ncbi:MAG: hypothetical protein WD623_00125 [Marinobacter sp.]|uniref:hypothetical protein n=1 Tax=Marinobacter sp. TaxID=50741 RepID=UPI0034A050CA
MNRTRQQSIQWWLGVLDVSATGVAEGALRLERVHHAIADESFNILARIPVTRPISEPVRVIHHGISRLSYRSVAYIAAGAQKLSGLPGKPLKPASVE